MDFYGTSGDDVIDQQKQKLGDNIKIFGGWVDACLGANKACCGDWKQRSSRLSNLSVNLDTRTLFIGTKLSEVQRLNRE